MVNVAEAAKEYVNRRIVFVIVVDNVDACFSLLSRVRFSQFIKLI